MSEIKQYRCDKCGCVIEGDRYSLSSALCNFFISGLLSLTDTFVDTSKKDFCSLDCMTFFIKDRAKRQKETKKVEFGEPR